MCLISVRNKPNKYLYIILTVDYLLMSSRINGKTSNDMQCNTVQMRCRS